MLLCIVMFVKQIPRAVVSTTPASHCIIEEHQQLPTIYRIHLVLLALVQFELDLLASHNAPLELATVIRIVVVVRRRPRGAAAAAAVTAA